MMFIVPALVMGVTSILLQISALRKLLSAFTGNELVIGIFFSAWLGTIGIGSMIGNRLRSQSAFAVSFILAGLLAQPTILLIENARLFLSLAPGETASLNSTAAAAFLTLLPAGLVLGSQFPLCASLLSGNGRKVFGLEAAGACTGGMIYTFLLAGRIDAFSIASVLCVVNLMTGAVLMRDKRLLVLLIVPLSLYLVRSEVLFPLASQDTRLVSRAESRYGEIEVFQDSGQLSVYASGGFRYSYPDPQTDEISAHVPLSLHASPEHLLVIGGSLSVMTEILKYDISRSVFIETDPAMIALALDLLSPSDRAALNDDRLEIVPGDARRFIKSADATRYDMVLLNLPEPSTAGINRFYTVEFFREVKAVMKQKGVLCLSLPVSSGYISRRMQYANGSVYASLQKVFSRVESSSEEYGGLYASESPIETDPAVLGKRFVDRHIDTEYFYPLLFKDIFDPARTMMVKTRLQNKSIENSDMKPAAYLYNTMLWSDTHGGRMLIPLLALEKRQMAAAVFVAFLFLIAVLWTTGRAVEYAVFTNGYSAMGASIIILLAFQAAFGYIYEAVWLITAMFMAGMATGCLVFPGNASRMRLQMIEVMTVVLLAFMPLMFTSPILYYIASFLAGLVAGMQFSAAAGYLKEKAADAAGRLYAVDLAGSLAGALSISILIVPMLGITLSITALIVIKASSLILLVSGRRPMVRSIPSSN